MRLRYVRVALARLVVLSFSLCILFTLTDKTNAQSANTISINPAFISMELLQGEAQTSSEISITNNYTTPINLDIEAKGIDQISGQLVPAEALDGQLKQSLFISDEKILIESGQSRQLGIKIINSDQLAPGGHYATLQITESDLNGNSNGLKGAVSISLFVVKRGGSTEQLNFKSLKPNGSLFSIPNRLTAVLENTGNTHTVPRGVASVSNGADTISKGVLNDAAIPLLPGKDYSFEVPLEKINSYPWLPVKLNVNIEYRTDGSTEIYRQSISKWYVPPVTVLVIFCVGLTLYTVFYFMRRKQNTSTRKNSRNKSSEPDENTAVSIHVRRVKKVNVKTDD